MSDKFKLDGRTPVPCSDLMEWVKWFETANRTVARSQIGDVSISTVFLGLDHSFGDGPPLLFETMIFGGSNSEYQTRCGSWDEAEKQHEEAVALVRSGLN